MSVYVALVLWCASAAGEERIHGSVLCARTTLPVAEAIILAPGLPPVTSGSRGEFSFDAPDSGHIHLQVYRAGYALADTICPISPGSPMLVLFLSENPYSIAPVVVTATRAPAVEDMVSPAVASIPSSDLRFRTSSDLGELMASVPNVVTRSYGGVGDVRTISLRGSTAGQVLVLLDGERLNGGQSGEVDLSTIPLDAVRRVEVLRGGASAQYGADAVGGVVNIMTEEANGERGWLGSAGVGAGSFGEREGDVRLTGRTSDNVFGVLYRYHRSDNTFPYQLSDGNEEARRNADAHAHALTVFDKFVLPEDEGVLRARGQFFVQDGGDPGMLGSPYLHARRQNRNLMFSAAFDRTYSAHSVTAQSSLHLFRLDYRNPDGLVPISTTADNAAAGLEIRDVFALNRSTVATAGYALRWDDVHGDALEADHRRMSHGFFVQAEIQPLNERNTSGLFLSVVPAVRWDMFSDVENNLSPKVGFLVSTGGTMTLTLRGNAGLSFRAPTFNDLYWPRDNFSAGNPDLVPERSSDADVGLFVRMRSTPGLSFGATYFHNAMRDMILWSPGRGGVWSPVNIGRATIRGWETEAGIGPVMGTVRVDWHYTWLDARDHSGEPNTDGMQLPYRPEHAHSVSCSFAAGPFFFRGDLTYFSRRYTTAANTVYLPPSHTVDLAVGCCWPFVGGAAEATFKMFDIEDERNTMIEGYPVPGRRFRVNVSFSFESTRAVDAPPCISR